MWSVKGGVVTALSHCVIASKCIREVVAIQQACGIVAGSVVMCTVYRSDVWLERAKSVVARIEGVCLTVRMAASIGRGQNEGAGSESRGYVCPVVVTVERPTDRHGHQFHRCQQCRLSLIKSTPLKSMLA